MKTEVWEMIDGHDVAQLSDEKKAIIRAELKRDQEELMRECAARKAERKAARKSGKIN